MRAVEAVNRSLSWRGRGLNPTMCYLLSYYYAIKVPILQYTGIGNLPLTISPHEKRYCLPVKYLNFHNISRCTFGRFMPHESSEDKIC